MSLLGIHHITVMASDPQQNADFYTDVLGLRLVKRTINFDAPDVYHLYYGDETGTPGTLLTFFPFPHAVRGKRGSGEISAVAYSIAGPSLDYWIKRLSQKGISFDDPAERFGEQAIAFLDPDGMKVELIVSDSHRNVKPWTRGPVPAKHTLAKFHGVTLQMHDAAKSMKYLDQLEFRRGAFKGNRQRFFLGSGVAEAAVDVLEDRSLRPSRQSAGSVHHIAWRVADDVNQLAWRERIVKLGGNVTEVVERCYFRSIYFREPGGVLFEIATDGPGMLIDEEAATLGMALKLPPWYEEQRNNIQRSLPPLAVKVANTEALR